MILKPEIEMVLEAHSQWLTNFHEILHGQRPFELKLIQSVHHCTLGDWLNKEGRAKIEPALHQEINFAHEEFHRIAAEVLLKIRDRKFAEAKKDIGPNGALRKASFRLKKLLSKLAFQKAYIASTGNDASSASEPEQDGTSAETPASTAST